MNISLDVKYNPILYKYFTIFSNTIFVWPILIPYMKSKGLDFFHIMLFYSSIEILTILLEVPTGIAADHFGYKKIINVGSFLKSLAFIFLMFYDMTNIFIFIISVFLFAISDSLLSGSTTAILYDSLIVLNKENEYKSIIRSTRSLTMYSLAIATLSSGFLFELNPYIPFILTILFLLLSFFVSIFYYNEKRDNIKKYNVFQFEYIKNNIPEFRSILPITFIIAIFTFFYSNMNFIAQEYMLALNVNPKYFGIVFFFSNIISAIVLKKGDMIENILKKNTKWLMCLYLSVCYIVLFISKNMLISLLTIPLMRISSATILPLLDVELNKSIRSSDRATILSMNNAIVGLILFVLDPFLGKLIDMYNIFNVLKILTIISILYSLYLYIVSFKNENVSENVNADIN